MKKENLTHFDIEYCEEMQFENFDFPRESQQFLDSLEDNTYSKIFQLLMEEIPVKTILRQIKVQSMDIKCLIFLLQSFWGYRNQEMQILRNRDMTLISHIKCPVANIYLLNVK